MKHENGWGFPEGDDLFPQPFSNMQILCLTCGVRVWITDLTLHQDWHWKLEQDVHRN